MNIKLKISLIAISFMALLAGCASPKDQSAKTGWNINDPKWGGFQVLQEYEQPTPPDMVFIQGGSFVMGTSQEDIMKDYNMISRRVTVSSFYMDEVEVRNTDYNEYLYWLGRIYEESFPEVVRRAEPDELCWRRPDTYVEHLVEFYFRHPTYKDYPVVGVTWEQANDYCTWRTDRLNEKILIDMGFLQFDMEQTAEQHFTTAGYYTKLYTGIEKKSLEDMAPNAIEKKRRVEMKDGILLPSFRLPTEAEWEYAAYGLIGNTYDERVIERRVYPWNGTNVRMNDPEHMGQMQANFVRGRGDMMGVAGNLNDGADYTTNVYAYAPNDFGLYNMASNVSEWTSDVYRVLTHEDAYELNPYRGNEYKTMVRNEDGTVADLDSLGRVQYRPVTAEEVANRRNYQKADNRNYGDGDLASAVVDDWTAQVDGPTSGLVYDPNVSLVNDNSRVIKGGSFRDRAYWISPANRRYLDQDRSEAWLGFRCAMPRIGTQAKVTR